MPQESNPRMSKRHKQPIPSTGTHRLVFHVERLDVQQGALFVEGALGIHQSLRRDTTVNASDCPFRTVPHKHGRHVRLFSFLSLSVSLCFGRG